jgi:hypothetical protein
MFAQALPRVQTNNLPAAYFAQDPRRKNIAQTHSVILMYHVDSDAIRRLAFRLICWIWFLSEFARIPKRMLALT